MQTARALLSVLSFSAALVLPAQQPTPLLPAQSGVRLVYDVPIDPLQRALRARPERNVQQALADVVTTVQGRLGDAVKVARAGITGFTVDVPVAQAAHVEQFRRRVEHLGLLEMRAVATDDARGPTKFKMDDEKARLQRWLDAGGKALVLADWRTIERFNSTPADQGGPAASGKLAWYPRIVTLRPSDESAWNYAFSKVANDLLPSVALFADTDWNGGVVPPTADRKKGLLELVAIDVSEVHFTGDDLDARRIKVQHGRDGAPAIGYQLKAEKAGDYGDWSEKYVARHSAIILNGCVMSAPVFRSRIPAQGIIEGDFKPAEAEDLVAVLKTRPLPVVPVLVRQEQLPGDTRK
jgi:SecDF, P1 head subdomain